jgi:hypothetical protein
MLDLAPTGPRPGFRELGILPRSLEEELSAMLKANEETHWPKPQKRPVPDGG